MYRYRLNEIEKGDTDVKNGIKTKVTDIEPNSGGITWKVTYGADMGIVIGKLNDIIDSVNKIRTQHKEDKYFSLFLDDIKVIRNDYRSHIRSEYPEEYETIKKKKSYMKEDEELDEESTSGGAGEYSTPFAFNKNKNAKGTSNIKVYKKFGYELAPNLHKNSKQLFEDEL